MKPEVGKIYVFEHDMIGNWPFIVLRVYPEDSHFDYRYLYSKDRTKFSGSLMFGSYDMTCPTYVRFKPSKLHSTSVMKELLKLREL